MAKPRIILADTDIDYLMKLQHKFVSEYFEKIDLEVISNPVYLMETFSKPQRADILVVSEDLYSSNLQRHTIQHIFLLTENGEEGGTGSLNVKKVPKYTSIKEIFNEITGKAAFVLNFRNSEKKDPELLVVTSGAGGTGKTTMALGIAACLAKEYKKVLYVNADDLQCFGHFLENPGPISSNEIYSRLGGYCDNPYREIRHLIRTEHFSYVPPCKAAFISLGLDSGIMVDLAFQAKKSGDYDYVVVDTNNLFDEKKTRLLNEADKVMVVTGQGRHSALATNALISSIHGVSNERYIFICNDFRQDEENAYTRQDLNLNYWINEYVEHIKGYDQMTISDFADQTGIKRAVYLLT